MKDLVELPSGNFIDFSRVIGALLVSSPYRGLKLIIDIPAATGGLTAIDIDGEDAAFAVAALRKRKQPADPTWPPS